MDTPERQRQHQVGCDSGGLAEHPDEFVTGKHMESAHPYGRWSNGGGVIVTSRDVGAQARVTEAARLRPGCTIEAGRRQGRRRWDVVTFRRKRTR